MKARASPSLEIASHQQKTKKNISLQKFHIFEKQRMMSNLFLSLIIKKNKVFKNG